MEMNLLLGTGMTILCMALQCIVVTGIILGVHALIERHVIKPAPLPAWMLLMGVLLALFIGTLAQTVLWAGLFMSLGEFSEFRTAFYHSVVNFSTLGYGDIVMSDEHRILGALESINGVLMLGLSTSLLFSILRSVTQILHEGRQQHAAHTGPK